MAYNGWKNYESWAVALWLDNDEGSYERAREMAREKRAEAGDSDRSAAGLLADGLKEWVTDEMIPDLGSSLAADLLGAAVSEVDWYEVAEHYLDDLEPEEADDNASSVHTGD